MYKYDCRKCPIRNRCIDESDNAPSVKTMIRNAFGVRTDTRATWGLLQKNCLLVKADEERAKRSTEESMLSRRLRQIREAREGPSTPPTPSQKPAQRPDYLQPVSPPSPDWAAPSAEEKRPNATAQPQSRWETSSLGHPTPDTSAWTGPISDEPRPDIIGAVEALPKALPNKQRAAANQSRPYWLTVSGSNRHIALPTSGELVLGRFDPNLGLPPDVDLAYEDGGARAISRRHAKIVGVEGRHTIEDLGSRHGLFLNGEQVQFRPSRPLQPGDHISLGNIRLYYDLIPVERLIVTATPQAQHILLVTPTGQQLTIAPPHDIVIGRSDRYVDFTPDVDLNSSGDVAIRVSRRHAIITWRKGNPYIEDLGSGFGTRLNGEMLLLGQAVPLKPGDHIWLGGCVLAYDVEI
ncbi:MAG TPA: FHA domain-containing protein [Anaerolineae bacterium]|nr:FHA domain-containing protein [Anaerolineae bacterium]